MRKIAVFTGTRAEYGLLYWIIKELDMCADMQLQLYVGGTHLSHDFGYTVTQIEEDGFDIMERLDFLASTDDTQGIATSMGQALIGSAKAFAQHQPDLLILLGDRYEALAVAQAAMLARIPIAHIHGGEITQGAMDDSIRHAISKLAHLHFASTEKHRQRIIQLGEQPDTVFNVGAPGLDNIHKSSLLSLSELSKSLGFELGENYFVVTYHPETLAADNGQQALINLLQALDNFPEVRLLITYPNADSGAKALIELYQQYQSAQPDRVVLVQSLGQQRYLSSVKHCKAVIGNSSSGVIEVPSLHKPTVDIGNRQQGRESAATVIHCKDSTAAIEQAIQRAISPEFTEICQHAHNPYGSGNVANKIVNKIQTMNLTMLSVKQFYDLPVNEDLG
ncbi:UDP-N-acetylglucosamine 2-epimerase [Aliiglaciecola litoralis]|uniref:UDP-N-acetylglucosamine 2-epimerase n=1 Tax=Aliiglaciecola litoralis TaxID=582857 RepID=A0ABN1LKC2_9ALTE